MSYNRILLKLSGEALLGERNHGVDPKRILAYSKEIKEIVDAGIELAIVIGGGNILEEFQVQVMELIEFKLIIWVCWQQ